MCITKSLYHAPETSHSTVNQLHSSVCDIASQGCKLGNPRAEACSRNTDEREGCAHPPQELIASQEEGRSSRRDTGRTRAWSSRLRPPWRFPGAWRLDPGAVQLRESVPVACFVIFSV